MKLPAEFLSDKYTSMTLPQFTEAIVRHCAKVCREQRLSPEDEKYDNEIANKIGEGTSYNMGVAFAADAIFAEFGLDATKQSAEKE